MQALLTVILVPLILLNLVGGIVGGIWLAVRGEWVVLGLGLVYMVATPLALSLALLPSMIFAAPAAALMDRGHAILGSIVALPAMAWTYVVLGGSCLLVLAYTAAAWDSGSLIPYLLWGYAVAVAPWAYLAQKDEQSGQSDSNTTLFFAQLATVSMGIALLMNGGYMYWTDLAVWGAPFLAIGLFLQWVLALGMAVEARRFSPLQRLQRSLYR